MVVKNVFGNSAEPYKNLYKTSIFVYKRKKKNDTNIKKEIVISCCPESELSKNNPKFNGAKN